MYKEIIVNTFDTIFKNSNSLIQKLIIPTLLITLINFYLPIYISEEMITNLNIETLDPKIILIPAILIFLLIMINISIAITTHRISILGPDSVPKLGSYIFGLREFKFLFKSIIFGIIVSIILILVSLIPIVGIFLLPILAIILISRLSLVFPAVSCDQKFGFWESWKITKNYKILTIIMIIVFPVIFAFTVGLVYTLAIEFLIKLISPNLIGLYSILNVFIMVFSISALSSVYKYIRPNQLSIAVKREDIPTREIIQSSRKGVHKIIIHDMHKTDFQSLKKELKDQYTKLGFTIEAYNRDNTWLVKDNQDEEAYVSLRYEDDEYTIQAKKTDEPKLKILKTINKK